MTTKKQHDTRTKTLLQYLRESVADAIEGEREFFADLAATRKRKGSLATFFKWDGRRAMRVSLKREWCQRCIDALTKDESKATFDSLLRWLEDQLVADATINSREEYDRLSMEQVAFLIRHMREMRP